MERNVKIAKELVKLAKSLVAKQIRLTMDDVDNQLINMGFDDDVISESDKRECIERATKTCESYPELNDEDNQEESWEGWIEVLEDVLWKKLKELGIEEV